VYAYTTATPPKSLKSPSEEATNIGEKREVWIDQPQATNRIIAKTKSNRNKLSVGPALHGKGIRRINL
jgi:hypothetical protein